VTLPPNHKHRQVKGAGSDEKRRPLKTKPGKGAKHGADYE
jgi:hypothetical protein